MSEQNKSNVQALGAGLLGFVVVVAVGGGALMLHSSQRAKSAAAPAPAAAPIDLGAAMARPTLDRAPIQQERRAQSPAPLIGEVEESPAEEGSSYSASAGEAPAADSPEAAPTAKSPALKVTRHLDASGAGSTAEAVVKNTLEAKKAALPGKKAPEPSPKLEIPAGEGAVASTVHYGVTSRNELMGRAAGPVYNIKGSKGGGASTAAAGKLAENAEARIADLRRQLETSGLPADQREKLLKDLDAAMSRAGGDAKTAQ